MCIGMGKAPSPPPPLEEDASVLEQRKRMRDDQNRQMTEDKEDQFEQRVAAYSGKQGRRSLLTGRKGGTGYGMNSNLQSGKTLGI